MSIVSDVVSSFLPHKKKITPSGWISFNAPCCHHLGHAQDTRGRGGLIINNNGGVSYHCFNCGFKCSWQSGRNLSLKFKKFLEWLNTPDDVIKQLSLDLLKQIESTTLKNALPKLPVFKETSLPENSICINTCNNVPNNLYPIIEYISTRNLNFTDTKFHWCSNLAYKDRLIIPFYFKNKIVGYTARTIQNKTPKYLTSSQPGYIFNLDNQNEEYKFMILCEGPIDALHIKGVSILGSELSDSQITLLKSYNKEIIVIPDKDKSGKKLCNQALDLGWSVSLPNWDKNINDVSDAVNKYGRLLTLYTIIKAKESNSLKIKLGAKKWFG